MGSGSGAVSWGIVLGLLLVFGGGMAVVVLVVRGLVRAGEYQRRLRAQRILEAASARARRAYDADVRRAKDGKR